MNKPTHRPVAVELFAGGGGVAVGLKKAGFRVAVAVELDQFAAQTYKRNHPRTKLLVEDVCKIGGERLMELAGGQRIDLLAACPPCQGFCSLTSKYRKEDERNALVREVARVAEETLPTALMFENVPGLAEKGRPLFQELLDRLEALGYRCSWKVVQLADYGIPQRRRRLVMLAGRGFTIEIPDPTHSFDGRNGLKKWNDLRSAIGHIDEEALELPDAMAVGGPRKVGWHVVRRISDLNRKRLAAAKAGVSLHELPKKLRPLCHQSVTEGFSNVYGRMSWESPSSTITAGCLTPSMGRFGHPEKDRTISLKEAALIQTFPKDYVFDTDFVEKATRIVGNALPCNFAKLLARRALKAILSRKDLPAQ
jgi:DNA (cytosine-5)-methyltransferase 1